MTKREAQAQAFCDRLMEHVRKTHSTGHYAQGNVEWLDFAESQYDPAQIHCFSAGTYIARYPVTKNEKDILKAVHYISRLWALEHPAETAVPAVPGVPVPLLLE